MIRTVALDAGNVLIGVDFKRAHRSVSKLTGLEEAEIRRRLSDSNLPTAYETGRISSAEFYESCRGLLGLPVSYEEFGRLWCEIFTEPLIEESLLKTLRERVSLLVASNTNELHFDFLLEQHPLFRLFDGLVLSYQVGAIKPDAEFFEALIARSGHGPESCFFTDDRIENVEGARRLGIDAELFQGVPTLLRGLRERGIEV